MPLALLAVLGLRESIWPRLAGIWRPLTLAAIAVLALPSNLLVSAATLGAIQRRDPAIFLTRDEAAGLAWLAVNAPAGAVMAASPEMGLFIPARTDVRVIYGHPFETVAADEQRNAVDEFYAGQVPAARFVRHHQVVFVWLGDRERALGTGPVTRGWQAVYSGGSVVIYAP
jgi:hypothetical protein